MITEGLDCLYSCSSSGKSGGVLDSFWLWLELLDCCVQCYSQLLTGIYTHTKTSGLFFKVFILYKYKYKYKGILYVKFQLTQKYFYYSGLCFKNPIEICYLNGLWSLPVSSLIFLIIFIY